MKFAILGAGAMGSLAGACLAEAGQEVFLIGRQAHIDKIIKKGLHVKGIKGERSVKINGGTDPVDLPFIPDVCIVTIKISDNRQVMDSIKDKITEKTILLTFQNGISIDELSPFSGKTKVLAAVTGWAATFDAPGEITHTSDGDFKIGGDPKKIDHQNDPDIKTLVSALSLFAKTEVSENIAGHLWIKMLIASLYSSLAVGGLRFGDVINNSKIKKLIFSLWKEGYQAAAALGIKLETYLGQLVPEMLVVNTVTDFVIGSFVIDMMLKDRREHKPSVLQDLEKGKKTEVPYINGAIIRYAEKTGIAVPMNRAVAGMIAEIENGNRQIRKSNLVLLDRALLFGMEKAGLSHLQC